MIGDLALQIKPVWFLPFEPPPIFFRKPSPGDVPARRAHKPQERDTVLDRAHVIEDFACAEGNAAAAVIHHPKQRNVAKCPTAIDCCNDC
jgi:hypothetical protein